jgi:hypothetical protein
MDVIISSLIIMNVLFGCVFTDILKMPAAESNAEEFGGNRTHHHHNNLNNQQFNSNRGVVGTMSPSVLTSDRTRPISNVSGHKPNDISTMRDRSKLFQLAERTSSRKMSPSPNNHLLSFRASPKKSSHVPPSSSEMNPSFLRRNNSSAITPSSDTEHRTPRQNPKLYTSFSSKSSSKLTKAFIKSDPANTNIEHLVGPIHKKVSPTPNSAESNKSSKLDHCENGRGISNFITPLKALHASFHDRTKLVNAFSPRSRLTSQREKSGSNARLISPHLSGRTSVEIITEGNHELISRSNFPLPSPSSSSDVSSDTPEIDYYGNGKVHGGMRNNNRSADAGEMRKASTPDILEDCIEFDQDSGYIIMERGRHQQQKWHPSHLNPLVHRESVLDNGSKSSTHQDPIMSTTFASNKTMMNTRRDTEGLFNESVSSHPTPTATNKMMSTATPMKLSSSSACRAQIITLMTRGSGDNASCETNNIYPHVRGEVDNETTTVKSSHDSGRFSAGVEFKEKVLLNQRTEEIQNHHQRNKIHSPSSSGKNNQPQKGDHSPTSVAGSCAWVDSKSCDRSEEVISRRRSSSSAAVSMGMISSNVLQERISSEEIDSVTDYKTDDEMKKRQYFANEFSSKCAVGGRTGLETKRSSATSSAHLHHHNGSDEIDVTPGNSIIRASSAYQINNGIGCGSGGKRNEDCSVIGNNFSISSSSQQYKAIIHGGGGGGCSKPAARKLSSRSARLKSKCRPLLHSFSFRSDRKSTEGCGEGYNNMNMEDASSFPRNRSRSLPKSFMSVNKYGLRGVLPR